MIPRDSYNFREMLPVQSLVWWRSHMWSALKARVGGFNDMLCFTLGETIHFAKIFSSGLGIIPTNNFKGYQQPVFRMWPTHAIGKCLKSWELDRTWQARLKIEVGRWKNERVHPKREVSSRTNVDHQTVFFLGGGDSDQGFTLPGLGV